jgi:2,5-dihydroxypyridine 5,6-dioxygenase
MPVSDHQMIKAWDEVLRLSKLQPGQAVSILCGPHTHPQTLRAATISAQAAGAVVTRIELPPINAEKATSRDLLNYLGETPLTGNPAAMAALKNSDLVLDLMLLLFSPEQMEILESGTKILLAVSRRRCWCGPCPPRPTASACRPLRNCSSAPGRCT